MLGTRALPLAIGLMLPAIALKLPLASGLMLPIRAVCWCDSLCSC